MTLGTDKAAFLGRFVERVTFQRKIDIVRIINSVCFISFFINFVWLVNIIFKQKNQLYFSVQNEEFNLGRAEGKQKGDILTGQKHSVVPKCNPAPSWMELLRCCWEQKLLCSVLSNCWNFGVLWCKRDHICDVLVPSGLRAYE